MQDELGKLEAGLRQIPPAAAPPELMERLRAATAGMQAEDRPAWRRIFRWDELFIGWRGLAAGAAAAIVVLGWLAWHPATKPGKINLADSPGTKVNAVQVGHSLVASFDTVAQVPGGEPVRFRCREWQDDVVIHDDAHGMVISKSTPRVEVVPVRFETY